MHEICFERIFMILKSFRKRKKQNIYLYRNKQRETSPPSRLFSFCFQQSIRGIWKKKERRKKGNRRKKLAPFWKVMSFFLVFNKWMIPYITIRRPAAAAAVAITGKQKRNRDRKDKKIALVVQHPCQPRVDRPGPPSENPLYIARRDLSFLFSIDIVNDIVLSNHFIHSSASLATLRYAKKNHRYRYRYRVPYPLPSLRVYNKKHHRLLARFIKTITPPLKCLQQS